MLMLGLGVLVAWVGQRLWLTRADFRTRPWWFHLALLLASLVGGLGLVRSSWSAQKLVAILAMPAGIFWMGLGLAALWSAGLARWRWATQWSGVFIIYSLVGNGNLGTALHNLLERDYPPLEIAAGTHDFDAVFVMGGGSAWTGRGRPQLHRAGDRVMLAAQIQRIGWSKFLVASGRQLGTGRNLAAETKQIWQSLGVPESAIIELPMPRNSREEVAAYAELARRRGWRSMGLVSSAWHLPRALALCEVHGLQVEPLPADHRGGPLLWTARRLIPQEGGFSGVQRASWELLGRLTGR